MNMCPPPPPINDLPRPLRVTVPLVTSRSNVIRISILQTYCNNVITKGPTHVQFQTLISTTLYVHWHFYY